MCMFNRKHTTLKNIMTRRFLPTTNFIPNNNSDVVESSVVVYTSVLECAIEYMRMYMGYRVSVGVIQLKCVKHFFKYPIVYTASQTAYTTVLRYISQQNRVIVVGNN